MTSLPHDVVDGRPVPAMTREERAAPHCLASAPHSLAPAPDSLAALVFPDSPVAPHTVIGPRRGVASPTLSAVTGIPAAS